MTGRMLKGAVALAALTGLLGAMVAGPAGAAGPITKKMVKKIAKAQAKKYFNQNIGGASVANATNATNATNAENAKTVNGIAVQQIGFRGDIGASGTILTLSGLILKVSCAAGSETIIADTTENDGEISSISTDASNDTIFNTFEDAFSPGDNVDLTGGNSPSDRIYTIIYSRPGGGAVTVHLVTEDNIGANVCIVSGHAIG